MRIYETPILPREYDPVPLRELLTQVIQQLNGLSAGTLAPVHTADTAPPAGGGPYAVGDVVRNAAPAEAGTAGSKYVVTGWVCTVAGSPGTWLPLRSLTGN